VLYEIKSQFKYDQIIKFGDFSNLVWLFYFILFKFIFLNAFFSFWKLNKFVLLLFFIGVKRYGKI
jgi:hypothetical protein